MKTVDVLIAELLALDLSAETRADLETAQEELREGTLYEGEANYIRQLHGRLVGGGAVPRANVAAASASSAATVAAASRAAPSPEGGEQLQAVIAERDRLAQEVRELRAELGALKQAAPGDDSGLAQLKAVLARLATSETGTDGPLRAQILQEVQAEIARIETGGQ